MTTITDTVLYISIQIQRHVPMKAASKMYPITVRFQTHMCHCNTIGQQLSTVVTQFYNYLSSFH